jgi:hypothetical protein
VLSPVAQEFRRCHCRVDTATDLEAGIAAISRGTEQSNEYAAVLADIVLPKRKAEPGISRYLGFSVAAAAAEQSCVKRIAFLTVVSFRELQKRFKELQGKHAGVEFRYFNKADLLSPGSMRALSDFVRVSCDVRKP